MRRAVTPLSPTASPRRRRTAAPCAADAPSIWQLCAHGHNLHFLKWYSHLNSLLQAAAIEPGQLGTVQAPPRLSQSQGVVNRFKRFAALIRIV